MDVGVEGEASFVVPHGRGEKCREGELLDEASPPPWFNETWRPFKPEFRSLATGLNDSSLPPSLSIFGGGGEPAPRVTTNLRIRDTKTAWISRSVLLFHSARVEIFVREARKYEPVPKGNLKLTGWI